MKLIKYAQPVTDNEELVEVINAAKDASIDGQWASGKRVKEFEKKLAEFLGVKYALTCNSGSSANLLMTAAMDFPKGSEIITSATTFPTTVNPAIQLGLIPVFVDIDLNTLNMKPELVEKAVTKKTKAIIAMHTAGNPNGMNELQEIAEKHDLVLLEDNCDALGSKCDNRYTGTFGKAATLSFYPAHHITTGEGGAVLTNDREVADNVIRYRDWGREVIGNLNKSNSNSNTGRLPSDYNERFVFTRIGYNLKLTELQAALGIPQLKKLPSFIEARKKNFKKIFEGICCFEKFFYLPKATPNSSPSWFVFPLTVSEKANFSRKELVSHLESNNIETRTIWAGNIIHQPAYRNIKMKVFGKLENADLAMRNGFFFGVHPGLSGEDTDYIVGTIKKFFKEKELIFW